MVEAGDLTGIDYDPAAYLPSRGPEPDLFAAFAAFEAFEAFEAFDPVVSWQRDRGLRTTRSPGRFVRNGDQAASKTAFAEPSLPGRPATSPAAIETRVADLFAAFCSSEAHRKSDQADAVVRRGGTGRRKNAEDAIVSS